MLKKIILKLKSFLKKERKSSTIKISKTKHQAHKILLCSKKF